MKKAFLAIALAFAGVASAFAVSKPDFRYADIADRLRADCAAGTLKFDLNAKDLDGHTALYYAIDHNDLELVKALVRHKAKVNRPCDDDGEYPLAVASGFFNREEIARYLVEAGAKVKRADKKKNTPLHVAAQNGRVGLVRLYLEKGAKLEAKNAEGDTPFLSACEDFDGWDGDKVATRRFLLEKGAKANAINKYGQNAFNILFNKLNGFGLLYCYYPDSELLKSLVTAGVDINHSGKYFESPLFACVAASAGMMNARPVIAELVALGADTEKTDKDGNTPLLFAVASGNIPAVSILLDCGADPAKRAADGSAANDIIEKMRQSDYDGFVYDDMKELLDSRATGDRSCLSIPKDTKVERTGGKVVYAADVTNVFEILRNLDPADDTVVRIAPVANSRLYFYLQRYLSMIPSPVTLDLTECDPTKIIQEVNLCLPNVKKIVYPECRPDKGDASDFYAYNVSNFYDLGELAVPEGIKTMQRYSVTRLDGITELYIPESVTEIEDEAIWGCANLERVYVKNKNAKIGDNALSRCPKAKIVFD